MSSMRHIAYRDSPLAIGSAALAQLAQTDAARPGCPRSERQRRRHRHQLCPGATGGGCAPTKAIASPIMPASSSPIPAGPRKPRCGAGPKRRWSPAKTPLTVISFFRSDLPKSGNGFARLADAYAATGKPTEAARRGPRRLGIAGPVRPPMKPASVSRYAAEPVGQPTMTAAPMPCCSPSDRPMPSASCLMLRQPAAPHSRPGSRCRPAPPTPMRCTARSRARCRAMPAC